MTQTNVYIINPVVMGVPNTNLSNFTCLLVDFGKVVCSCANELQQNSNTSPREIFCCPFYRSFKPHHGVDDDNDNDNVIKQLVLSS